MAQPLIIEQQLQQAIVQQLKQAEGSQASEHLVSLERPRGEDSSYCTLIVDSGLSLLCSICCSCTSDMEMNGSQYRTTWLLRYAHLCRNTASPTSKKPMCLKMSPAAAGKQQFWSTKRD